MRVQGNKKSIFTRDRKPKAAAHEKKRRWIQIPNFGYKNIKKQAAPASLKSGEYLADMTVK